MYEILLLMKHQVRNAFGPLEDEEGAMPAASHVAQFLQKWLSSGVLLRDPYNSVLPNSYHYDVNLCLSLVGDIERLLSDLSLLTVLSHEENTIF